MIFDSTGKFLHSVGLPKDVDRTKAVPMLVRRGPADSMYLFDGGMFLLRVFSPAGVHVRDVKLKVDGTSDLALLSNSSLVFSADMPTPEAVGYPLHVFTSGGKYERSFGADVAVYRADAAFLIDRRIAPASRDRAFWSVRTARYVIELMDLHGRSSMTIERGAPWFNIDDSWRHPSKSRRQPAQVTSVFEDKSGRLWITSIVPDSGWRSVVSDSIGANGKAAWKIASYDRYFDTVLEVLDPIRRTVIATRRFDECLPYLIGDKYLASFGASNNGAPSIDLWRVNLLIQSSGGTP